MSYILDAIKKAESQRRQDKVPTLEDIVAGGRKQKKAIPWKGVLAVLMLVSLVAAAYWYRQPVTDAVGDVYARIGNYAATVKERYRPSDEQVEAGVETRVETRTAEEQVGTAENDPKKQSGDTRNKQVTGVLNAVSAKKDKKNKVSGATASSTSRQSGSSTRFTPAVQQRLDNLGFSVLSYSTDPAQRFIMAGSKVLREGDSLGEFRILHIVREGVMVDVGGQDYLVRP